MERSTFHNYACFIMNWYLYFMPEISFTLSLRILKVHWFHSHPLHSEQTYAHWVDPGESGAFPVCGVPLLLVRKGILPEEGTHGNLMKFIHEIIAFSTRSRLMCTRSPFSAPDPFFFSSIFHSSQNWICSWLMRSLRRRLTSRGRSKRMCARLLTKRRMIDSEQ